MDTNKIIDMQIKPQTDIESVYRQTKNRAGYLKVNNKISPVESIESEGTFWHNQIVRHHIGKTVRNLVRKELEKELAKKKFDEKSRINPFEIISRQLGVSRKTIWAIANGLTTASKSLMERIERLENES
jgi:hypothetical protein